MSCCPVRANLGRGPWRRPELKLSEEAACRKALALSSGPWEQLGWVRAQPGEDQKAWLGEMGAVCASGRAPLWKHNCGYEARESCAEPPSQGCSPGCLRDLTCKMKTWEDSFPGFSWF